MRRVADMAVAAGGKALAASGLSPADIDLVIVATCTPEAPIPNTAATVATRLGIVAPGAFDLNAACAGFCYALGTASDAVRAGTSRHVLVIGAEKLSQWVDWTDRSTCIIFADGAGAAVVGPAEAARPASGPWSGVAMAAWRTRSSSRTASRSSSRRGRRCSAGRPRPCTPSP